MDNDKIEINEERGYLVIKAPALMLLTNKEHKLLNKLAKTLEKRFQKENNKNERI